MFGVSKVVHLNSTVEASVTDVRITISKNGSLKVEGDPPLFDADGNRIQPPREDRYFLCRCGESSNKPFCDGSHKEVGFDSRLAAQDG